MRIGLQVSADRGRYATKVEKLQADARWADEAGLDTIWTPQIPDEIDVMTAVTLIGLATSRIEVGTAIVPLQPRHPVVLAQQALSNQAVCEGRFTLGLGVSHHWIIGDMMGLPYERPATTMRCYLDVLDQALARPGDGRRGERAVHDPQPPRHHRHHADAGHDRRPRPGHAEAGRRAGGGHHVVAGRRAHHRLARRAHDHEGRRGSGPPRPPHHGGRAGVPLRRRRGRRGRREDQPHPERGRGLAQLRAADGARRRRDHRRRPDLRQRGCDGEAAPQLRRRRGHRPQRPHRAARRGPGADQGVGRADPRVPRRRGALAAAS